LYVTSTIAYYDATTVIYKRKLCIALTASGKAGASIILKNQTIDI
jgi:hypothetical protein